MMEKASNKLFVYGTLRRGLALHRHLSETSPRFLGMGSINARLYDLGEYPGAVKSREPNEFVEGEVYELTEPATQLRELDHLEEFDRENPRKSLFLRETVEVRMRAGQKITAWAYFLPKSPSRGRLVRRGDYVQSRLSRSKVQASR